tara:strand:+ start:3598 stop:10290 length:6693 start_codon:yes stop_codon:yes gene_type:complete
MSLKDYFYNKQTAAASATSASADVESKDFIVTKLVNNKTFTPHLDFASASNFAKFGSAYEYYTRAIERIYNDYPYDGSEKEKLEFEISSSYLDEYIFNKRYPKTTGYINMSHDTWGTAASITDGYGIPNSAADYEYIFVKGGVHTRADLVDTSLKTVFKNSPIIYDSAKDRTTTFVLDMPTGFSVEFWLKKDAFSLAKTKKEVILDLWNGELSSSANYGRFTLELSGTANGQDVFRATLYSGSTGFFSQPIGTSTITTGSLSSWAHYAFTAVSGASGITSRLYKNGDLNENKTLGSAGMGAIGGLINGYIGALQTNPSGSSAAKYAGKLSASLDDFRFWKTRRTSEQIYNNWYRPVGGGTNSDEANTKLGLYFKFNEGIVGNTTTDSIILDYSGRIANGAWTGYTAGARNTGSAFISSSLVAREAEDPIIYSGHSRVQSLLTELQTSGSHWDIQNPTLLYNTIPHWIRNEDESTNENVKYLFQIMSSYFDTLYSQISVLPHIKNIQYITPEYKPKPFADRLIEDRGLLVPNLFVNSDILEKYGSRDSNKILFEDDINNIKNFVYTNIYNNLSFILKTKGTERSIRNMLRCFGIDDEIVKLNIYTDGGTHYLSDKRKHTAHRKRFINFNNSNTFESTIYQTSSANTSYTFVTGSGASKLEKYSAMTSEITIKVPVKIPEDRKQFFNTPFLSSSIFGMHEPLNSANYNNYAWKTNEIANFQVYLVRDKQESTNAKFVLKTQDETTYLTTGFYSEVYDNDLWTLAVRVKPDAYPFAGGHLETTNPTYTLEFYGVTHAFENVESEFLLTASLSYDSGSSFLSNAKRFYVGAHKQNFTGSTLQKTDLKIGTFRHYMDYLETDTIKNHNLDITNYAHGKGLQATTAFNSQLGGVLVPSADTIVINWDFDTVTGSNAAGGYTVDDISSGSSTETYGWIDGIINTEHKAAGSSFPASSTSFASKESTFISKKELPEISYTADNVHIADEKRKFFIEDEDLSDNFFVLEKSMNQVVSEEMLNTFSSIAEFNSLVGKATDRYRMQYKQLDFYRQMFFQRNTGDLDIERFTEYYKWIDTSISFMVNQLFPISVRHSEGIMDVVESHILERNKYQNKFPLLTTYTATENAIKGRKELNYNWKHGHAPIDKTENDNCLWQKERAQRPDIVERETIRKAIINENDAKSSILGKADGTSYKSNLYHDRRLAQTIDLKKNIVRTIHGGINYPENKDREFVHNAVMRHGPKTSIGVPKNVLIVGEGPGQGINQQQVCNDTIDPNLLTKIHVQATVGRFAAGGVVPSASSDADIYAYRNDESKIPMNIISASVTTGYNARVSSSYSDVIFTNIHSDTTYFENDIPMQGPFAEGWVGGHQSRHVEINKYDASLIDDFTGVVPKNNVDNQYTRPEAWRLLLGDKHSSDGAFAFSGFDYGGPYPDPTRKGATYYRGERAKRPVNIENIKTTTGSKRHGNYMENFEVISAAGRRENNLYLRNNTNQSLYIPTSIGSELPSTTHPMSLVGKEPFSEGNVFGSHKNNRQPNGQCYNLAYGQGIYLNDTFMSDTLFSGYTNGNGFAFSLWLKIPDGEIPQSGIQYLLYAKDNSGNVVVTILLGNNFSKFTFTCRYSDGTSTNKTFTASDGGEWKHYVFTFDGVTAYNGGSQTADNLKLYINGVSQPALSTGSSVGADKAASDLRVIQDITRIGDTDIKLYLDDIAVWDSYFTEANVSELYNSGCYSNLSTHSKAADYLVSWWPIKDWGVGSTDTTGSIKEFDNRNTLTVATPASASFVSGGAPTISRQSSLDVVIAVPDDLLNGSKNRTIITSRFSAPGGIEVQSKGYLDAYSHEYSVHNSLAYRNMTVRGSGSGESGTIRSSDVHENRFGLRTHLSRHSGKFGSDSVIGSVTEANYVTIPSYHKIQRNIARKPDSNTEKSSPIFNEDHNNAFFQSPIPQSEFQYSWLTASIGNNYSIHSGKQRVYGYAPRNGEVIDGPSSAAFANFNGIDSYINIGNAARWQALVGTGNSNNAFTVSAWIKLRDYQKFSSIISFGDDMILYVDIVGRLVFRVGNGWDSGGFVFWVTDPELIPKSLWTHVSITYNYSSTGNNPVLYINGEAQTVYEIDGPPAGSFTGVNTEDSHIGKWSSSYFNGFISNVAIWSNALSAAQVLRIYNAGISPTEVLANPTNLAAFYEITKRTLGHIQGDTASQINDRSGNSYNSTATNNISLVEENPNSPVEALVFPSASEIFGV